MPSHTLAYIKAPKWFHNEINKRRRAYFWTGQKSATGAQCKVAWDTVCRPTEEGGLNIKNLEIQNTCLLLKFIHKLHTSNRSSWAKWIKTYVYKGHKRLGDKLSVCSSSWRSLMPLIQLYRDLTWVTIGDGTSTCFWLDSWIGKKPLSIQYPALFSHVQNPNITVAESCTELGWQIRLRHLTSLRAENELLNRLEQISLREEPDERYMRFGPDKKFLVKGCYHALNFGGTTIPGHKEVWDSWAPKKCKIFAWLDLHNRLNTRARLARRGIIEDTNCPFDCQTEEILTHLLFHWSHISSLWPIFQVQIMQGGNSVQQLITNAGHMPPAQRGEWASLFIAIAWNIWKTRNRKVFDNVTYPVRRIEEDCWGTIARWANRCRNIDRRRAIKDWVTAARTI
jgi:hypothetical protein